MNAATKPQPIAAALTWPAVPGPSAEALAVCADGAMGVEDACSFTGLGPTELYDRMKAGTLTFTRVGKRRLIPRKSLVALLAQNLVRAEM